MREAAAVLSHRELGRLRAARALSGQDVPRQRRLEEVKTAGEFGSTFVDPTSGETRSYASLIPEVAAGAEQLEREELPARSQRAQERVAVADRIELMMQRTGWGPRWAERYPTRLRTSRRSGCVVVELATGRCISFWDNKAGLPRYCPDDARDEAGRLTRRYLPKLVQWQAAGYWITYAVFTTPNAAAGRLRDEMHSIERKFARLCKKFPIIEGTLTVLEAPLGRARDWNGHLNAILVTKGFVRWGDIRKAWHWDVELQKLPDGEDALRGALTELIKYAVRPTPSKSAEKAACHAHNKHPADTTAAQDCARAAQASGGDSARAPDRGPLGRPRSAVRSIDDTAAGGPVGATQEPLPAHAQLGEAEEAPGLGEVPGAPAFVEWSDAELIEWMEAMHGFRRTRSTGRLYGIKKPEPEKLGPTVAIGTVNFDRVVLRYRWHCPLLDSIPEDKSLTPDPVARWRIFLRRVLPREPSGLEGLEGRLPRLAELG